MVEANATWGKKRKQRHNVWDTTEDAATWIESMVCVRPGGHRGMALETPSSTYLCELPGSQFPPLDDAPIFSSQTPHFLPLALFSFLLPFFFFSITPLR